MYPYVQYTNTIQFIIMLYIFAGFRIGFNIRRTYIIYFSIKNEQSKKPKDAPCI